MEDNEKQLLIQLIKSAKGDSSLDKFSERTGISKFQLSRIMNGKFKEMPHKSTLKAIANGSTDDYAKEVLENYTSDVMLFKDFDKEYNIPKDTLENVEGFIKFKREHQKRWNTFKKCKGIVLRELADCGCDLYVKYTTFDKKKPVGLQPLLTVAPLKNNAISEWDFYFEPSLKAYEDNFFYTFLGKVFCVEHPKNKKLTLILADKGLYDDISALTMSITNMSAHLSIIYIDMEEQKICSENYIYVLPNPDYNALKELIISEETKYCLDETCSPESREALKVVIKGTTVNTEIHENIE